MARPPHAEAGNRLSAGSELPVEADPDRTRCLVARRGLIVRIWRTSSGITAFVKVDGRSAVEQIEHIGSQNQIAELGIGDLVAGGHVEPGLPLTLEFRTAAGCDALAVPG